METRRKVHRPRLLLDFSHLIDRRSVRAISSVGSLFIQKIRLEHIVATETWMTGRMFQIRIIVDNMDFNIAQLTEPECMLLPGLGHSLEGVITDAWTTVKKLNTSLMWPVV